MSDLAARWRAFRAEHPAVRACEAAARLGVSEAELVASGCGETATRLDGDWEALLTSLPALGRVRAVTRNDAAVHERKGAYCDVSVHGSMALVLGDDIDLRIFLARWCFGFAVQEAVDGRVRRSLQVFDPSGAAVHKVHLTDASELNAYDALVGRLRLRDQSPALALEPPKPAATPRPDSEIDVRSLAAAWAALEDTHDFFAMLRKFEVARTQAFRLVGSKFAVSAPVSSGRTILQIAAGRRTPLMVFVGNPGCIQIHTGRVSRLETADPGFNVLDPDFNFHLRENLVASAWVVRKPTRDGIVTSLELYDAAGNLIVQFFGKRKPGQAESTDWRRIVEGLVEPATV